VSSYEDRQTARRVCRHSDELLAAIRQRVDELQTNYLSVEAVSGIQLGYLTKVTANPPPKRMGLHVCFLILTALGLQVELTEAPDFQRYAQRLERRKLTRRPGRITGRSKKCAPDFYAYISRLGNEARSRKLSPERRSALARSAAQARWRARKEQLAPHRQPVC
jgi:hypothetical protein